MFYYSQNCNRSILADAPLLSEKKASAGQFKAMSAVTLSLVASFTLLNNFTTNKI
jgi:hypothetical protein